MNALTPGNGFRLIRIGTDVGKIFLAQDNPVENICTDIGFRLVRIDPMVLH